MRGLTINKIVLIAILFVSIFIVSMVAISANLFVKSQSADGLATYLIVPDDYATINDAIANLADGGTIAIRAGVYNENLWIMHPLTLVGLDQQNTILSSPYGGDLVEVQSNDVTITNLTIHSTQDCYATINIDSVQNISITNCIIMSDRSHVIWTARTTDVQIANNTFLNTRGDAVHIDYKSVNTVIANNTFSNIGCYDWWANAIFLRQCTSTIIGNNSIENVRGQAINTQNVGTVAGLTIRGNTISQCQSGVINLFYVNNLDLTNNTIRNNYNQAIMLNRVTQATIQNNVIDQNNGSSFSSNVLANAVIQNNIFTNQWQGMNFGQTNNNVTVYNNVISNSNDGIGFGGDSHYITIANNTVQQNPNGGINVNGAADNIIIGNNTVNNNGNFGDPQNWVNGIGVNKASTVEIENNTVTQNTGQGISTWNTCNNVQVTNNVAQNNRREGISLSQSSNVLVQNNTATDNNQNGISLGQGQNFMVVGNVVANNNGDGINTWQTTAISIQNNTVTDSNNQGIVAAESSNVNVTDNIVRNCLNGNGVCLDRQITGAIVFNNTISDGNNNGIWIGTLSSGISVTGNNIERIMGNAAIQVNGGSTSNIIINNNFINQNGGSSHWVRGVSCYLVSNLEVGNNTITNNSGEGFAGGNTCDQITIKNNTISNNGGGICGGPYTNMLIQNNTFVNDWSGVSLGGGQNVTIKDNLVVGSNSDGINLNGQVHVTIKNNTVSDSNNQGIVFGDSSNITVTNNTICGTHNNSGFNANNINDASILGNAITDNNRGIDIGGTSYNIQINQNIIDRNIWGAINLNGPGTYGITVRDNSIQSNGDNAIAGPTSGIWLNNIVKTNISNNTISFNTGNGISIAQGSRDITIDGNTVASNGQEGINGWQSQVITLSNNQITNSGGNGVSFTNGIDTIAVISNTADGNGLSGININAPNTVIQGNVVSNNHAIQGPGMPPSGIWANGDNCTIDGNVVVYNNDGISCGGNSGNVSITNNLVSHINPQNGPASIQVDNADGFFVACNNVTDNPHGGIGVGNSINGQIRDNFVSSNLQEGISTWGTSNLVIEDNTVQFNGDETHSANGINVNGQGRVSNITVQGNVITGNWGQGIISNDMSSLIISHNIISANKNDGINIWNIDEATIQDNEVQLEGDETHFANGVSLNNINNAEITDNIIGNCTGQAFNINQIANALIQGNIAGNSLEGINLNGGADDIIIQNNLVEGNFNNGININGMTHYITVRDNTICDNNDGLNLNNANYVTITNNSIANSRRWGICGGGNNDLVTNNTITGCSADGINLGLWQYNTTISFNQIHNNGGNGVQLNNAQRFTINNNLITGNANGIGVFGASGNGNISNNMILLCNNDGVSTNGVYNLNIVNNSVEFSGLSGFGNGMNLNNANSAAITDNYIVGNNGNGIQTQNENNLNLRNNTIFQNTQQGLNLNNVHGFTLLTNNVTSNQRQGIYARDSSELNLLSNTVTGNGITGNMAGIEFNWNVINSLIQSNNASVNYGSGIFIGGNCGNTNITSNLVLNNTLNGININSWQNAPIQVTYNIVNGSGVPGGVNPPFAQGISIGSANNINVVSNSVNNNVGQGISCWSSNNIMISNNNATSNMAGIIINGQYNATSNNINILNNTISININNGINVMNASNVYIQNNFVGNTTGNFANGISFNTVRYGTIAGNVITGNRNLAVNLMNSTVALVGNTITGNSAGATLQNSNNCLVASNTFNNNNTTLAIVGCNQTLIASNNFYNAPLGVLLLNSNFTTVRSNNVTSIAGYGLHLINSSNNTIFSNRFVNNGATYGGQQVSVNSDCFNNAWNFSYPTGGNYWSDYTGIDNYHGVNQNIAGSDGLIDSPNALNSTNIDYYPLRNDGSSAIMLYVPPEQGTSIINMVSVYTNSTVTGIQEVTQHRVNFTASGASGDYGFLRIVTAANASNLLNIRVFVNNTEILSPNLLVDANADHSQYLIYFTTHFSTVNISLQYSIAPPAPSDIIVDDSAASFVGSWPSSTSTPGYYGSGYRYHNAGTGANTATWSFSVPSAGSWEVFARWTSYSSRASNAKFTVNCASGSSVVIVNQQLNGGSWQSLGTFSFGAGVYNVSLSDNANGIVIADAIRLVPSSMSIQYTLTVSTIGSGNVTRSPVQCTYDFGSNVTLNAVPTAGYVFSGWSGAITGSVNPTSILMTGNKTVIATFAPAPPPEVVVDDSAASFVGSWPSSTSTPGYYGSGYRYHNAGTGANTATWSFSVPSAGSWEVFARWTSYSSRASNAKFTVNCASGSSVVIVNQQLNGGSWQSLGTFSFGAGVYNVSLSDNANGIVIADAIRLVPRYSLTVNVVGSGSVSVDPNQGTYIPGSNVTVTAVPAAGFEFAGWGGALGGSSNSSWILMDGDKTITATFVPSAFVVDDSAASFVGTWTSATFTPGYYGSGYRYHNAGTGANTATWSFSVPSAGSWEVFARWTSYSSRASNAKFTVNCASGSSVVIVNQQLNGGSWQSLGTFSFGAGVYNVSLSDNANGIVIADAIRLVPST